MNDTSMSNRSEAEDISAEGRGSLGDSNLSSESVANMAMGLLSNLTDDERKLLEGIITPRSAQLLAKAFGPEFWSLLSPLLEDDSDEDRDRAEDELRNVMRDPRYWRDHDSELVRRVTDGFRRLYPE